MVRRSWTEQELLVALKVYCELNFGQFHSKNNTIIEVSALLNRTPSALAMKLGNFASLDPAMGGKGLSSASKADKKIMNTYLAEPERMILKALQHYNSVKLPIMDEKISSPEYSGFSEDRLSDFIPQGETDGYATTKIRKGQSFFRSAVLSNYNFQCSVCQIDISSLLIASHIIPWAKDKERRLLPSNGLSLCMLHDKAFDAGLIAISEEYKVLLGDTIKEKSEKTPAIKDMFQAYEEQSLQLPFRFLPDKGGLEWHRNHIFLH